MSGYIAIAAAWLTTVLGNLPRLLKRGDRNERLFAGAVIVVASMVATWGWWEVWQERERTKSLEAALRQPIVSEASGGAVDEGGVAYIVDDDRPVVFRAQYDARSHLFVDLEPVALVENGVELTDKDVDDLEGAAFHRGRLYLITSHSNKRNGEDVDGRKRLVEVQLKTDPRGVRYGEVLRSVNLRPHLLPYFTGDRRIADPAWDRPPDPKLHKEVVMEIEGLAIGNDGQAYFGLRAPLDLQGRAILFQAPLEKVLELKPDAPTRELFRPILLKFRVGSTEEQLGITSLEFEPSKGGDGKPGPGQLCMLASSPVRDNTDVAPKAFCWTPCDAPREQTPTLVNAKLFDPSLFRAKPEVLLLAPDGRQVVTFVDSRGTGGQLTWTRAAFGWPEASAGASCGTPGG